MTVILNPFPIRSSIQTQKNCMMRINMEMIRVTKNGPINDLKLNRYNLFKLLFLQKQNYFKIRRQLNGEDFESVAPTCALHLLFHRSLLLLLDSVLSSRKKASESFQRNQASMSKLQNTHRSLASRLNYLEKKYINSL